MYIPLVELPYARSNIFSGYTTLEKLNTQLVSVNSSNYKNSNIPDAIVAIRCDLPLCVLVGRTTQLRAVYSS